MHRAPAAGVERIGCSHFLAERMRVALLVSRAGVFSYAFEQLTSGCLDSLDP